MRKQKAYPEVACASKPSRKSRGKVAKVETPRKKRTSAIIKRTVAANNRKGAALERVSKPILVVLPGASGSLSTAATEQLIPRLGEIFDVRVRPGRWNVAKPGASANVSSVLTLCPSEPLEWYVMGHSFGNRVCCSMLADRLFPVPPAGVILAGYPMYSEKGTDERVSLLQKLPGDCRLLCISGMKDKFLSRGPAQGSQSPQRVYEDIVGTLPCAGNTVLHLLPNGGHSVIDVPKAQLAEVVDVVLSWITGFTGLS